MPNRVLSIQSHVVQGYVGGKAAVFPLQLLGYDVDVINTVQFSNHSGYGKFGGSKTSAADLDILFGHLEGNEMIEEVGRLLTGYVPGPQALNSIARFARKLRQREGGEQLVYVLDPVMGDAGQLYVSREVIPIYKKMLPLATVITPNWFEVEVLTGIKLTSACAIKNALNVLHVEYRVPNVVISSLPLTSELQAELPPDIAKSSISSPDEGLEHILVICSSYTENKMTTHAIRVPKVNGYFSGVGDLFSALILGHFSSSPSPAPFSPQLLHPLPVATFLTLKKLSHVLRATDAHVQEMEMEGEKNDTDEEKDKADPMRKVRRMKVRELRIVQEQDVLRRKSWEETETPTQMMRWEL